jgi:hypothetical protein
MYKSVVSATRAGQARGCALASLALAGVLGACDSFDFLSTFSTP